MLTDQEIVQVVREYQEKEMESRSFPDAAWLAWFEKEVRQAMGCDVDERIARMYAILQGSKFKEHHTKVSEQEFWRTFCRENLPYVIDHVSDEPKTVLRRVEQALDAIGGRK